MTLSFPLSGGILSGGSGNVSVIKTIQTVDLISNDWTASPFTRVDKTISAVDISNTLLLLGISPGNNAPGVYQFNIEITSPTNLRFNRGQTTGASGGFGTVQVIEFFPGIIKSNQFVSTSGSGLAPANADITISSVDVSKSISVHHGSSFVSGSSDGSAIGRTSDLTSSTNLNVTILNGSAADNYVTRAQVLEFK